MHYYSPSTCGFYFDGIHSKIPQDAVELSDEKYEQLLAAQESGKQITVDEQGLPVAVEMSVVLSEQEQIEQRIAEIQQELTANDLASVRPLRAKLAGTATEFDDARLAELEEQAQALRTELATLTTQLEELSDQPTE